MKQFSPTEYNKPSTYPNKSTEAGSFRNSYPSDIIPVSYQPNEGGIFEADLYGAIESASQFSNIISALSFMKEDDVFILNLQSPGGHLGATDALIHSIRKCRGNIHIVATGDNSSCASFILLEASSFELSENFSSTCHCGSIGMGGTLSEFKHGTVAAVKSMERAIRSYYKYFFTPQELDQMIDGKDFILDAEEWVLRHNIRNEQYRLLHNEQCDDPDCEEHNSVDNLLERIAEQNAALDKQLTQMTSAVVLKAPKPVKKAKNAPK